MSCIDATQWRVVSANLRITLSRYFDQTIHVLVQSVIITQKYLKFHLLPFVYSPLPINQAYVGTKITESNSLLW